MSSEISITTDNEVNTEAAQRALQLWFACSMTHPYPSEFCGLNGQATTLYSNVQIPVLAIPPLSSMCQVTQLIRCLGIHQYSQTIFFPLSEVIAFISRRDNPDPFSREILNLLIRRALDCVRLFDMTIKGEVMQYLSLRLAVLQAQKSKLINLDRSEVVQIRKFIFQTGNFWITVDDHGVESSIVLSPDMVLGLQPGPFLLPKLFPEDLYGAETIIVPSVPPVKKPLGPSMPRPRGLCNSCWKFRQIRPRGQNIRVHYQASAEA